MQAIMMAPPRIRGAADIVGYPDALVLQLNAGRARRDVLDAISGHLTGAWVWTDMTITVGPRNPIGEQELLSRLGLVLDSLDQVERDEIRTAVLAGLRVDIDPGGPGGFGSTLPAITCGRVGPSPHRTPLPV